MDFPKGTEFKEETSPETGKKIKIAILPDGTTLKFWTGKNLEEI